MRSSQTIQAREEYELAEAERKRRMTQGLTFASVRHALVAMFERSRSMQSPLSHHPRGHIAADGSTVYLSVDCNGKSDPHELLATLQTIHDALEDLRAHNPVQHGMIVAHVRDGKTMVEVGQLAHCSPSTASREIDCAESFLLGWLRQGGVVRPGRVEGRL